MEIKIVRVSKVKRTFEVITTISATRDLPASAKQRVTSKPFTKYSNWQCY